PAACERVSVPSRLAPRIVKRGAVARRRLFCALRSARRRTGSERRWRLSGRRWDQIDLPPRSVRLGEDHTLSFGVHAEGPVANFAGEVEGVLRDAVTGELARVFHHARP